jgi:hypothetical protein
VNRGSGDIGLLGKQEPRPVAKLSVANRVAIEVAALADLPREELVDCWLVRFGQESPKGCGRKLLELAAAYGIQERAYGGLKPEIRRALALKIDPVLDDVASHRRSRRQAISTIKPGTRLVREWNGRTHHVEMVEGGFVWNGKTHRSLSMIAREITGAQWSGPRFFGL